MSILLEVSEFVDDHTKDAGAALWKCMTGDEDDVIDSREEDQLIPSFDSYASEDDMSLNSFPENSKGPRVRSPRDPPPGITPQYYFPRGVVPAVSRRPKTPEPRSTEAVTGTVDDRCQGSFLSLREKFEGKKHTSTQKNEVNKGVQENDTGVSVANQKCQNTSTPLLKSEAPNKPVTDPGKKKRLKNFPLRRVFQKSRTQKASKPSIDLFDHSFVEKTGTTIGFGTEDTPASPERQRRPRKNMAGPQKSSSTDGKQILSRRPTRPRPALGRKELPRTKDLQEETESNVPQRVEKARDEQPLSVSFVDEKRKGAGWRLRSITKTKKSPSATTMVQEEERLPEKSDPGEERFISRDGTKRAQLNVRSRSFFSKKKKSKSEEVGLTSRSDTSGETLRVNRATHSSKGWFPSWNASGKNSSDPNVKNSSVIRQWIDASESECSIPSALMDGLIPGHRGERKSYSMTKLHKVIDRVQSHQDNDLETSFDEGDEDEYYGDEDDPEYEGNEGVLDGEAYEEYADELEYEGNEGVLDGEAHDEYVDELEYQDSEDLLDGEAYDDDDDVLDGEAYYEEYEGAEGAYYSDEENEMYDDADEVMQYERPGRVYEECEA